MANNCHQHEKYVCSYHIYIPAFSQRRVLDKSYLNDNVARSDPGAKNSHLGSGRRVEEYRGRRSLVNLRTDTKMVPEQISETVAVVKVPNYEEKYVGSVLDLATMKRYNDKVCFEPAMTPVHFAQTLICYKNSTRKRFVSRTFYEPRVKPKRFAETTIVYPKHPEKCFVSFLDYHIDECRKWFKTCMEFKAKTYTTTKIGVGLKNDTNVDNKVNESDNSPGASQVFLPRFNNDGAPYERKFKFALKPDINQNTNGPVNGY
ncbi:uncharacterized protein [Haliotis asinina]|uniref:uncharacterized protein n=1 Tax=Haliotis asinina TaxID=109174 RepID=UPI0035317F54